MCHYALCHTEAFSYHSSGNRSCLTCHTVQTQEWLEPRQAALLPVQYFHITATVPAELRDVPPSNQRGGYGVLMQAGVATISELAGDSRPLGATPAAVVTAAEAQPAR